MRNAISSSGETFCKSSYRLDSVWILNTSLLHGRYIRFNLFALSSLFPHKQRKAFDDFKNKQISVWSNVFWYVKVGTFWKCIEHTIHWDKTQMLKKFPFDKINGTKNALFFLSRNPAHHSFTFNLWFLYELEHKVRLSKIVRGSFHFWFRFVFIKYYIFVQQFAWVLWF